MLEEGRVHDDRDDDGPDAGDQRIALEHATGWAAYDTLEQFLTADKWFPAPIDGTTAFRCGFQGRSAKFRVIAHINVEMEQLYLYAVSEVYVPDDERIAVAEFIARANYGMRIGNLEIDMNDGEVRFKSSVDFDGAGLTEQLIRNAIYPAVTSMDRYFPGVMRVAFGGADPYDAIAEIEGFMIDGFDTDGDGSTDI